MNDCARLRITRRLEASLKPPIAERVCCAIAKAIGYQNNQYRPLELKAVLTVISETLNFNQKRVDKVWTPKLRKCISKAIRVDCRQRRDCFQRSCERDRAEEQHRREMLAAKGPEHACLVYHSFPDAKGRAMQPGICAEKRCDFYTGRYLCIAPNTTVTV